MNKKILIVDDTNSWLLFHTDLIKQLYGDYFEITLCDNAKSALKKVKNNIQNPYDIIITDLQMEEDFEPKTAGEWLVEEIKQIHSYYLPKIIIISGMFNIELIAKNLNVECISKQRLINNKLLLKYMFENLIPSLKNINNN